ncbi:MAG: phenylalanine--tRNA ligase subunit alpha [Firmicutes bacterium]|nr:phenylalanine--tRNA ligase subunit alpha [Bacillota bacterium]
MRDKIEKILDEVRAAVLACSGSAAILDVRVKYLGKAGAITELKKGLRDVAAEERPAFGALINDAAGEIESIIESKLSEIKLKELNAQLESEKIDTSVPSYFFGGHSGGYGGTGQVGKADKTNSGVVSSGVASLPLGSYHPLTLVREKMVDIFLRLGFEVKDGPEIETDYYCFEALNIPKDHPARDMQDTFYIQSKSKEKLVLRTHTSSVQIRTMLSEKPPLKIVVPGKVYRADHSARHSPMFSQLEGLVVDKNVNLQDLLGVLSLFAKELFGADTKIRFRPSFFPYTEPSVEVDMVCIFCAEGSRCLVCQNSGYIEILGAGLVHPKVLANCGIDSKVYSGLAFGVGLERVAMLLYGIPDIRMLFENDVRLLRQFV